MSLQTRITALAEHVGMLLKLVTYDRVTTGEKTAASEANVRTFSPSDVKNMIDLHTPGGPGSVGNSNAAGAGTNFALTTTEQQVLSVQITPSHSAAKIAVFARLDATKDSGNTVRNVTARLRRGTLNTDPQLGQDSIVGSVGSAGVLFGPAVLLQIDSPGTTSPVTYTLRALASSALNATRYTLTVFEIATKGATGPTGPAPTGSVGSGTVVDCSSIGGKFVGWGTALTGNLTVNNATAVLGGNARIRHNDSVIPTFPSNFTKVGSVNYATGQNNTIVVECVDVNANPALNQYIYVISQ